MTAINANIINKYQNLAPQGVVQAVRVAAQRTGADFGFLMEKAAAESSFDPKAKARTSSATGLFQFIDSTWLGMVKKYGHKYGLGDMARHIENNNGKPCVKDCATRNKILELRKDPRLSALMAGEFTAENRAVLQKNTKGDVGATELYLAHFMGAGGACKFLNSRDCNPDAVAKDIFPNAAKANRNIFYDRATGQPRTLDEIYSHFAKKFGETEKTATAKPALTEKPVPEKQIPDTALSAAAQAQVLAVFDDANENDDIIWSDDPRFFRAPATKPASSPLERISPMTILTLAEMTDSLPGRWGRKDKYGYNS